MNREITFRTKTGYCHVLPDSIVLTRDGIAGNVAKVVVGNNIARIMIIYGFAVLVLLYIAYDDYKQGQIVMPIWFSFMAVFFIYGIVASSKNSATPYIPRNSIKAVTFKKGVYGLTRSRFEVLFETEDGKVKKRLILLPGSLTGGAFDEEKALAILREEKLLG